MNSNNTLTASLLAERTANLFWAGTHLTPSERALLAEHTSNPNVWNSEENRAVLAALLARVPPTKQALTLWSGLEVPLGALYLGTPTPGLMYLTSSYLPAVAQKYARAHSAMLVLTIPPGSHLLFLDAVSVHGDSEGEVLLSPHASLLATRVDRQWQQEDEEGRDDIIVLEVDYIE